MTLQSSALVNFIAANLLMAFKKKLSLRRQRRWCFCSAGFRMSLCFHCRCAGIPVERQKGRRRTKGS